MRKGFMRSSAVICLLVCFGIPLLALAADARVANEANATGGGTVAVTVVMPQSEPTPVTALSDPLPSPQPKPSPELPALYPNSVHEFYDDTGRQIIKTYELTDSENPGGISRESFQRDGWLYELTDITKQETASVSSREHVETVTLSLPSREMEAILAELKPTLEYRSADGHSGTLALDIGSITIETAGTQTSSYTMTATREYPHLSSNDTSLVPKTISEYGVTYTLSGVNWKTQTEAVDTTQIPVSYTAIAEYKATGTKTSVTGYTIKAEYRGSIARILSGRTVYTAYFWESKLNPTATRDVASVTSAFTPQLGAMSPYVLPTVLAAAFIGFLNRFAWRKKTRKERMM